MIQTYERYTNGVIKCARRRFDHFINPTLDRYSALTYKLIDASKKEYLIPYSGALRDDGNIKLTIFYVFFFF